MTSPSRVRASASSPAIRTVAVSRLEKRGLVERVACVGDTWAINVHLTREGRRAWLKATPPHVEFARDALLGDSTPEQLETLAELFEVVLGKLDADDESAVIEFPVQRAAQ